MEKVELLKKWLLDELTPEEQREFDAMDNAPLHKAIIAYAPNFKASQVSEPGTFETLRKKLPQKQPKIRRISWKRTWLQIASVLVIGFAFYYAFFNEQITQITTLAAEKTTLILPDDSEVVLNAASTIQYQEDDWVEERELQLQGEAFFKVAKGKRFDVKTSEGTVSVLGTQFNVKQRGSYFEVVCYEGIVQVTHTNTVKKLLAGDAFRMNRGISWEGITQDIAPQWTGNKSSFKSVAFQDVIEELERQYGISVSYNGSKKNGSFTGVFVHNDLENALQAITAPMGLTYTIKSAKKVEVLD